MKYGSLTFLLLFGLSAFSLSAQINLTSFSSLPNTINETSGLAANGSNKVWTHNDSGGENKLYEIDTMGNITRTLTILNATLVDWEEMAQDDQGNFYIGDFGNNGNARNNQKIYIIPNPDSISSDSVFAQVINLSYADQTAFPPPNNRRHYDMEGMIWYQDSLYLFSKNRTNPFDGYTRLYKMPDNPGTYSVSPVDSFYTGPGPKETFWITGADISPSGKQLMLLSYDKVWLFSCFSGSDFFNGDVQQLSLSALGQYEGIKFIDEATVYISNETSVTGTAALNKADISNFISVPFVDLGPDITTANLTATLLGGNQPSGSTYLWSNGSTNAQINVNMSGLYWLEVTNGSCVERDSISVTLLCQGFGSAASGTNIDCFGNQNGMIDLTVIGGTPGYNYSWSNGANSQDLNNLSAGTYNVTITDQNGCVRQQSITIVEPPILNASIQGTDVSCNGGSNGIVDLSVSGGTPGYTYSWSNGDTSQDLLNVAAGNYNVSVFDANNCNIPLSQTLTEPSPILVNLSPSATLCFGEASGSINLSVSGGIAGYRFAWNNGDTTQNVSNLSAGVYAVVVTDANNCPIQAVDTVDNAPPIGIALSNTDASCANIDDGSIDLTVAGGTPPYQYSWSNGATSEDLLGLGAGLYTFVLTDSNACSRTDSIAVSAPPAPIFSLDGQDVLCAGDSNGSVNLSLSGGVAPFSYLWSNGDSSSDLSAVPAGTYRLSLTDNLGCVFEDSLAISEPSVLLISNLSSTPDSTGSSGTISLSATGGTPPYSYAWSNAATDSSLSGLAAGDYAITITDANGCTVNDSVTVMLQSSISIEAPLGLQQFGIYPNPASDEVKLQIEWQIAQAARLRLYNLQGQLMWEGSLEASKTQEKIIQMGHLTQGIYLLELSSESGIWSKKIQKL
ncbi:MAG: T9SS type A sorting domain-containing protein [Bacteroidota bacterium]